MKAHHRTDLVATESILREGFRDAVDACEHRTRTSHSPSFYLFADSARGMRMRRGGRCYTGGTVQGASPPTLARG
jgi:hypothetical protein